MTIFAVEINSLDDGPADLAQYRGRALLVVNVASECDLTNQYTGLQALADRYADRGLVVLGVPCNQFGEQEPGTEAQIADFARRRYGVTFPMTEKVEVNGERRHPLYQQLVGTADTDGYAGDVRWNFEKFLIAPDGTVAARFAPGIEPGSGEVTTAIEQVLPVRG